MKTSIALAGILLAGTSIISAQAINGAGATFPYPIYGKVVRGIPAEESFHRDQLPVQRFWGRYCAAYRRHGGFRRVRHADEGRADRGTEVRRCTFRRAGGLVPTYNLPGLADLKFSSEMLAGIFLARSPSGTTQRSRKPIPASNCRPPTSSWFIAPMAAVPLSCSPIIFRRSARNGKRSGSEYLHQVADRCGPAGK